MTGGLQFYSLRKQLVDSGKMSEKEFHDTILKNNTMPVEIVKAILTGEELTKEASPKWKFLD
jgi:uncharacterized protein (DUF885 family)